MLAKVHRGEVDRAAVELVVARYQEDVEWTREWSPILTIIDKSPAPLDADGGGGVVVPLRNVGREQHSFVTHLTRRYDTLAARTAFLHGRAPSCGFYLASVDGTLGNHLLANTSLDDYLDASLRAPGGDSLDRELWLPLTLAYDANLTRVRHRFGFADVEVPRRLKSLEVPVAQSPPEGEDEWLPWEAHDLHAFLAGRVAPRPLRMRFDEFFASIIGRPPPPVVFFGQGGQFTASRDRLRKVPLATYQRIEAALATDDAEVGFYVEMLWPYLLGASLPPSAPLLGTGDGADDAEPLPFLHHLHEPWRRRQPSLSPHRWPPPSGAAPHCAWRAGLRAGCPRGSAVDR